MGVQWRKENPSPRVHRSSGKLGEPRYPLERVDPRVGIFLSPLDTHDGFYFTRIREMVQFSFDNIAKPLWFEASIHLKDT